MNKKEKRTKKIQIHRETLRQLGEADYQEVAGGLITITGGGGPNHCAECPPPTN